MGNRSGRRDGLHEVLGRSPDAGGAAAVHAGAGNGGAHRARWWALAVIAALVVALTTSGTPAQAQDNVWTATLTPASIGGGAFLGCDTETGAIARSCTTVTVLSDNDFTHDDTDYVIDAIYLSSGTLTLRLDTDITSDTATLILVVGSTYFAFSDATTITNRVRAWTSTGLSWTAGTDVTLTIVETPQVLVSNIGQARRGGNSIATGDLAQGFTTGRSPRGYTLTSIEVQITSAGVIDSAVVRKTDPNTGDLVATLTGPASGTGGGSTTVGTGAQTFTAPLGTSLEPSTEYFVVFESDASSNGLQIGLTRSADEDEGGAAGWSINNKDHWRSRTGTGNFISFGDPNRIRGERRHQGYVPLRAARGGPARQPL